jgi:hypothetical protein
LLAAVSMKKIVFEKFGYFQIYRNSRLLRLIEAVKDAFTVRTEREIAVRQTEADGFCLPAPGTSFRGRKMDRPTAGNPSLLDGDPLQDVETI